jgi:O-antigen ligase
MLDGYAATADRIGIEVQRWLVPLVPIALVSVSGVADVLCSIVAITFVARAAIRRSVAWFAQPWFIVLLLLWTYLCVRGLFAIRPFESLGEALIWLRYPVFALAVSDVLRNDADRARFIKCLAASVLFLSVDAILQYCIGYDVIGRPQDSDLRLTGPFGRPRVGITIAWMFLPAALALAVQRRFVWSALVGGASVVAIALSGERMALATLVLDAVALVILLPHRRREAMVVAGACAALLLLLIAARPALYQRQVETTWHVLTSLGESHYGVLWRSGLRIAEANPVFGVGMKEFRYVCPDPAYGPLLGPDNFPRCSTHPHNYYVEWTDAGGIPALIGFVVAMLLLLRDLLRFGDRRDLLFSGLVATVLMRLWPVATNTSFFIGWSGIPLFLMVGWALAYLPAPRSLPGKQRAPEVVQALR